MNKIELLPKDIYYYNSLYQINVWVTAWGNLCIGYRKAFDPLHDSLFSVTIEPENEPCPISKTTSSIINSYIGNMRTFDDACDELLNWINENSNQYKFKK